MEITLNSAITIAMPYAPYIAAGIATVAALAAIYFYMQRHELLPWQAPPKDLQNQAIVTFIDEADTASKEPMLNAATAKLHKAFETAAGSIKTPDKLAKLTESLINKTYDVFEKVTGRPKERLNNHTPLQNFLKAKFETLWAYPCPRSETYFQ